jgi:hypothetical protein
MLDVPWPGLWACICLGINLRLRLYVLCIRLIIIENTCY